MKERHVTRRSFFGIGATSMTEQAHSPNGTPFLRVCEPAPEFQSTLRLCKEYLRAFRKRYGAGTSYRVLLFREGRPIRQVKAGPYGLGAYQRAGSHPGPGGSLCDRPSGDGGHGLREDRTMPNGRLTSTGVLPGPHRPSYPAFRPVPAPDAGTGSTCARKEHRNERDHHMHNLSLP